VGPQIQFASESFIDEMPLQAAPAGGVPAALFEGVARHHRVKAAAQRAEWDPRPYEAGPQRRHPAGLGIAYAQRRAPS